MALPPRFLHETEDHFNVRRDDKVVNIAKQAQDVRFEKNVHSDLFCYKITLFPYSGKGHGRTYSPSIKGNAKSHFSEYFFAFSNSKH